MSQLGSHYGHGSETDLQGLSHAMVVGFLRSQTLVRCVALVREPGFLLKTLHALLGLLWNTGGNSPTIYNQWLGTRGGIKSGYSF